MLKTLKVVFLLVLALQLVCVGLAAVVTAVPLRLEVHALGVTRSYNDCPPSGDAGCDLANHMLSSGCALVSAQNHDVGTWEVYLDDLDVYDAADRASTQRLTFGIADCGTLLSHTYVVSLLVQGVFLGGPGVASAVLQPAEPGGGATRGEMWAHIYGYRCTDFFFMWHDASKGPLEYGGDYYAQVMPSDACS